MISLKKCPTMIIMGKSTAVVFSAPEVSFTKQQCSLSVLLDQQPKRDVFSD